MENSKLEMSDNSVYALPTTEKPCNCPGINPPPNINPNNVAAAVKSTGWTFWSLTTASWIIVIIFIILFMIFVAILIYYYFFSSSKNVAKAETTTCNPPKREYVCSPVPEYTCPAQIPAQIPAQMPLSQAHVPPIYGPYIAPPIVPVSNLNPPPVFKSIPVCNQALIFQ